MDVLGYVIANHALNIVTKSEARARIPAPNKWW